MPRRARISLPGVSLYLIQRGNNRSACFYADENYFFIWMYWWSKQRSMGVRTMHSADDQSVF